MVNIDWVYCLGTINCAIYDLKDHDVVSALKSVANKVTLRIAYDGGK
jgi:hypothetical protein